MALTATVHRFVIHLSDVDRGVYSDLELRVARHPSETMRYLLTRTFAYCLSYEEGIEFSKGGLSSAEEPPVSIRDATGVLRAWIDIGVPSADRIHKASKAAERVDVFTYAPIAQVRREAAARSIHRGDQIRVWVIPPAFLDALEPHVDRSTTFEVLRTGAHLYVTVSGRTFDALLTDEPLLSD